jgi:outer membrane protein assembly factor BamB
MILLRSLLVVFAVGAVAGAQDWPTHRGGPARTAAADAKPGPASPRILWVHKSKEQFLAPLSAGGDRLFVAALGAFNTGSIRSFGAADGKEAWSKGAPLVRLPTVGSPVLANGVLYFGEGMHQTNGSSLHAMRAADGRSLWRLDVPGELVHIEASPAIADGRLFVGGGSAGVIAVDLGKVTLDGKELSLDDAAKAVDAKWKELSDAYEKDKKKDPDFAIPPSEASLPKPAPKVAWEKGKGAWHVDAPVLAAGGRVYVATSYLEAEKFGERALVCLNAADGAELWKTPLAFNAWGGATLAGDRLIVTGSNIRYDPKELGHAKGEVLCVKADGAVEWRRPAERAYLASAAVSGDVAVVCDSAGEVSGLDLKTGKPRWTTKVGTAFFAGAALSGDAAYVCDLEGKLACLGLADGKSRWTLDLGATAPGMVYGGPVLSGGRLYVATSNLEGKSAGSETVIVCIGEGK